MRKLLVTVEWSRRPRESYMDTLEPPRIYREIVRVEIVFELKEGRTTRRMRVNMEGENRGDEEELRRQLKSYKWGEYEIDFVMGGDDPHEDDGEWVIEITDPHGILKWLGADAMDIFKQSNDFKNDKSLRLPALLTGPGT